ncbi:toll-like receptor 4 [Ylistrum balloti]|uniref:toll-like receptor 4 n=1 Tax=Ylistrum balloti TaxID=509963 RepID=UPI002905DF9B|nr:toll-like receptor 4 [Ylistrum balloti]
MKQLTTLIGVALLSVYLSTQDVDGQDTNKDGLDIPRDFTLTNHFQRVRSLTNSSTNCTAESVCRCYVSSNNTYVADCSHLDIEFVPRFHHSVSVIFLQGNKIRNFSGEGFPKSVTYLDLSGNKLYMFRSFPFKDLKNLEYLDLSNNFLQYTKSVFSDTIFQGLTNLTYLNIKQNNMKYTPTNLRFPISIAKLRNLETLLLDGVDLLGFDESFKLLTKLKILDLSGEAGICNIRKFRSDFFKNVPYVENLDISRCNIRAIEPGTFRGLKPLHTLNVSSNECLTFRVLANITNDMQYTSIRVLDISRLHCTFGPSTVIHRGDVENLHNTNLTHLYTESNRIAILETGVARKLPKSLKFLSISDNKLSFGLYYMEFMSELTNIEIIHAGHQGTAHNLETGSSDCNDWRAPPPSHDDVTFALSTELLSCNKNPLRMLNHDNKILTKFSFPASLRELYYRSNSMNFEIGSMYFEENNLEILDLSNNLFHSWRGPLNNLKHIKYLYMSHNYCSYMSDYIFPVDNNVKTLFIQNNLLGVVLSTDHDGRIFKNFTNLEILDLSTNHIYSLPSRLLQHQYTLQILNLSNNALSEFSLDLSEMRYLKYIDLRHNQLRTIKERQRDQIGSLKVNNVTVNLVGNTMDCSCMELEFLKWIGENKALFVNFHGYDCVFTNGTQASFTDFDGILIELSKSCDSYIAIIAVFASMVLLCLSLTISGIIYRYRWKLRYLFYMAKTRYKGYSTVAHAEDDDDYVFDAFVSYCSDDFCFVRGEVVPNLEEKQGLHLCLHQRDFIPGQEIAQNITNAIHQSRKTVVLLSRAYLKSYWCMYEFNMARMESIYSRGGNSVLLLVFYEDIPAKELPFMLLDLIESDSYIEYPKDDDHGKVVFWDKLTTAISPHLTTTL